MSGQEQHVPTLGDIGTIARAAPASLPPAFAPLLDNVVLSVDEFADGETLDAFDVENPLGLAGVHHGRPIGEKSSIESGAAPDRIHLYRRAILDEWVAGGGNPATLVRHIVIRDVGHHVGLSDAVMHRLEDEA